jgi:NAD(P)-dependent dehydrogenase (short-subunit alcohol dehydrogenase family)
MTGRDRWLVWIFIGPAVALVAALMYYPMIGTVIPSRSAYATAKGGINALTQQTAVELAPHKIRVNAIAPGTIMTPMNEKIFKGHPNPAALIKAWNERHPLGRFGQPDEVAEAALFLASERSSFVTGVLLRVDGGFVIGGS